MISSSQWAKIYAFWQGLIWQVNRPFLSQLVYLFIYPIWDFLFQPNIWKHRYLMDYWQLVVFDELFRGTNVKDAYEASLSVISAFSRLNRGVFAISTHIIEIADKLKESNSIFYKYFEANMVNETPRYNYKIKDGVTSERIGMYILRKEKVLETIENGIKQRCT